MKTDGKNLLKDWHLVYHHAYLQHIHWEEFFKSHCFEECQNCIIYNHHRAEKLVDVKPHPTKFGHHPIEQYSGVSQKLNFLFETGAIILNIDIISIYKH